MLEFTLGTIFGFVAGCSLKDFIMSKLSNYNKSYSQKSPIKLNREKLNFTMKKEMKQLQMEKDLIFALFSPHLKNME